MLVYAMTFRGDSPSSAPSMRHLRLLGWLRARGGAETLLSQLQTLELARQLINGCIFPCRLTGALVILPDGLETHLGAD